MIFILLLHVLLHSKLPSCVQVPFATSLLLLLLLPLVLLLLQGLLLLVMLFMHAVAFFAA